MSLSFDDAMILTRTVSSETAFDDAECYALFDLCMSMYAYSVVVEIGCQLGRSSSIILQCARERGFTPVHIDPWTEQPDYAAGWHSMATSLWTPHIVYQMRSIEARPYIAAMLAPSLVLIDGDHSQDSIWLDTRMASLVRPGGYLCAHDYGRNSLPDVNEVMDVYAVLPDWKHVGTYGTLGVWQRQYQYPNV